jgi:hypothetical protein
MAASNLADDNNAAVAAADPLTSLSGWLRPGGHRLTFFATREELQELLDAGLPGAFDPWHLTGADVVPRPDQTDRYYQCPWTSGVVDLLALDRKPGGRSRTNIFIWSERLTNRLPPLEPGTAFEGLCSFNGFLLIQPGDREDPSGYRETSLCIVDRIVNTTTGEERRYPEYFRVFNRLRRLVRKRLIASTVLMYPDGAEYVDTRTRWTRGAAAAHATGTKFILHGRSCRPLESALLTS